MIAVPLFAQGKDPKQTPVKSLKRGRRSCQKNKL
jgi:hypothetical protein